MKDAMIEKLSGMKSVELKAAYDAMMTDKEEEEEEAQVDESTLEDRLASVDVSEDVSALTQGEELSEEFKDKAATIFEAAVKSKLRSEVERIEEAKTQEIAEEINRVRDELTEKVDAYMNYVVEEWMKENEIAIERGLKGEIAEDFISGLKSLFEEHYIDVPDEKYDILGSQSDKIDELEAKLNEQIEKTAELKKSHDVLVRESVFAEVASDLADTEVEKFKSLAEEVEFTDEDSFKVKLDQLKESYFPKATTIAESVDSESDGSEAFDTTGAMAAYMAAISKNVKRAKN
jgi:small-conductance mechanosensitive channel